MKVFIFYLIVVISAGLGLICSLFSADILPVTFYSIVTYILSTIGGACVGMGIAYVIETTYLKLNDFLTEGTHKIQKQK